MGVLSVTVSERLLLENAKKSEFRKFLLTADVDFAHLSKWRHLLLKLQLEIESHLKCDETGG